MDCEFTKKYYELHKPIYSLDEYRDRRNELQEFLQDTSIRIKQDIIQLSQHNPNEELTKNIQDLAQELQDLEDNPELSLIKDYILPLQDPGYYPSLKLGMEEYWEGNIPKEEEEEADKSIYQMSSRNHRWLTIMRNSIKINPHSRKLFAFGYHHLNDILKDLSDEGIIIKRMNAEGNFEPFLLQ